MANRNEFPVHRRADGSIDTGIYADRAKKMHRARVGDFLISLMRAGMAAYRAMSKTSRPSVPPSIIPTRRAPSALWPGSSR